MSDGVGDLEMRIILDQTFITFDLLPGDSIPENTFIDVRSDVKWTLTIIYLKHHKFIFRNLLNYTKIHRNGP